MGPKYGKMLHVFGALALLSAPAFAAAQEDASTDDTRAAASADAGEGAAMTEAATSAAPEGAAAEAAATAESEAAATASEEEAAQPEDATKEAAEMQEEKVRPAEADEATEETAKPEEVVEAAPEAKEEEAAPKASLDLGGALRFNYFVKSWDGQEGNRKRLGDVALDTFRLNFDATYDVLVLSGEYRFYAGYSMLHHGYMGLKLDDTEIDLGVSRAPFGILPYASHSWFFNLSYYVGLEDDYDAGVKLTTNFGDLNLQAAFYKNTEGNYTGSSVDSARYSYDVVHTTVAELGYAGLTEDRNNSETNQGNLRLAYTLHHGEDLSTEIGVSGLYGQLYNGDTGDFGSHWAAAAHLNGNYGPVNVQLEYIAYGYDPANPAGADNNFVVMGAYDFPYLVAASGQLVQGGVSYALPIGWGPLDSLTFYEDFSALLKSHEGYENSLQNDVGVLIAAGPIYTYVDLAMGKNHPWVGPNYGSALAAGDPNAKWETRFNINLGWYF